MLLVENMYISFFLKNFSWGVTSCTSNVVHQFMRYTIALAASTQYDFGMFFLFIIALYLSIYHTSFHHFVCTSPIYFSHFHDKIKSNWVPWIYISHAHNIVVSTVATSSGTWTMDSSSHQGFPLR